MRPTFVARAKPVNRRFDTMRGRAETRRVASRLLVVLGVLTSLPVSAQELANPQSVPLAFPAAPGPRHALSDELELATPADRARIEEIAAALHRDKGVTLRLATIASLASHGASGWTIERYAADLFSKWDLSSDDVLLVVARDDRKARIHLGMAWDDSLEAEAVVLMRDHLVPRFKDRQYSEGLVLGAIGIDDMARGRGPRGSEQVSDLAVALVLGGLVFGAAIAVSIARKGRTGWGWTALTWLGYIAVGVVLIAVAVLLSDSKSSSSSRFGGSSSGGGGGGSSGGGGGATGSW